LRALYEKRKRFRRVRPAPAGLQDRRINIEETTGNCYKDGIIIVRRTEIKRMNVYKKKLNLHFLKSWKMRGLLAVGCCIGLMLCWHWLRSDLWMIVLGALFFIVGSAFLVLTEEWKEVKLKLLKAGLASILLATGGLLTTHGWNLRDNYFNDRARLVAMAAELHLNQIRIELLSISYHEYETTSNQDEMTALLLPSSHQVRQVLSYSDIQRNDANLADMVLEYVVAADLLNAKLAHIDRVCSNHIWAAEKTKKIIESGFGIKHNIFEAFRTTHKRLKGHITAKYSWCFEEANAKIRKPMLDDFNGAIAIRRIQLNRLERERRMKQLKDATRQQGTPIPNEESSQQPGLDPND